VNGWQCNTSPIEYADRFGSFRNTTTMGSINGMELHIGVIDDPVKGRMEASSKTTRERLWNWFTDHTVRDRMMDRYVATVESIAGKSTGSKIVAYLSAEFLAGPHLGNSLLCLGIGEAVEKALSQLGQDHSSLLEHEEEPGLGNGGGLAACFMDSLATRPPSATAPDTSLGFSIRQFVTVGRSS
jgi:hypothetical protein